MNIGKIAKAVGTSLLKNAVPGVGLVIDTVNAFLDDDKRLDVETATGQDLAAAVNTLPPEQQMQLMAKRFDVQIVETQSHAAIMESFSRADIAGASTRPEIANRHSKVVCFGALIVLTAFAIAIFQRDWQTIEKIGGCWELIAAVLAVIGRPVTRYFGERTREKEARYAAVTNTPFRGNFITDILTAIKK